MDLANGLTVVTPTLDAWVLRVLANTTRPLSGRQIAKLSEQGSVGGVHKVLARLVDQGIVTADAHPSATLYGLNREHLAAGPVMELAGLALKFLEQLEGLIGSWQVQPRHALLFGSAARGDGTSRSDVDLLLVHAEDLAFDPSQWGQQVDEVASTVRRWTGNEAGILDIGVGDLKQMIHNKEPILESWSRDGALLAGEPLPRVTPGRR